MNVIESRGNELGRTADKSDKRYICAFAVMAEISRCKNGKITLFFFNDSRIYNISLLKHTLKISKKFQIIYTEFRHN